MMVCQLRLGNERALFSGPILHDGWTTIRVVMLVAMLMLPALNSTCAQQTATAQEEDQDTGQAKPSAAIALPATNRDGRPLKLIGVYQSQLVDVVPPDFRVVSVGELREAIGADANAFSANARTRMENGFYDVRLDQNLLVSERSELVIEHPTNQSVVATLGHVNLAIADPIGQRAGLIVGNEVASGLEVDHLGNLLAVIPHHQSERTAEDRPSAEADAAGDESADSESADSESADSESADSDPADDDSNAVTSADSALERAAENNRSNAWTQSVIRFQWTLQSEPYGLGRRFEIRIPRTSQTRFVISTPSDIQLYCKQGVLVERPGPPPDADLQTRAGDIRWYVLEAGGVDRIELFSQRRSAEPIGVPVLVRKQSRQYEVDLSGVTWFHRIMLETRKRQERIRLKCPVGMVTEVSVNGIKKRFEITPQADGVSLIDVAIPSELFRSAGPTDLTSADPGERANATDHLLTLTVSGSAAWDLAGGQCPLPSVVPIDDGVCWAESSTQAVVSLIEPLELGRWELPEGWRQSVERITQEGQSLQTAEGPPQTAVEPSAAWSTLRLVRSRERQIEAVWNRLRLQESPTRQLYATTRVRCRLLRDHQSPVAIELNPNWTIDQVMVVASERRIAISPAAGELIVWPTPEESADVWFEIDIETHQNLPAGSNRILVPSTWVVRPKQFVSRYVTSIEPPPLRSWDANSVLLPNQIERSELTESQREFFKPTSETIQLSSHLSKIPSVALEPVDVSLSVSLQHRIQESEGALLESISVSAETTLPISQLSIATDNSIGAEFEWALRRIDQSATVNLPPALVRRSDADPIGFYTIDFDGRDLRRYELIGQRSIIPEDSLTLTLPVVQGANSQIAESLIDADWEIQSIPQGVQLVPEAGDDSQADDKQGAHRLRYDALSQPTIRLGRVDSNAKACLIWSQHLEVLAGSRGEDLFHFLATTSSRRPITVSYDRDLELISVATNGRPIEPKQVQWGSFVIDPDGQKRQLSLLLRRRHSSHSWIRRCRLPRIALDGHVLRSQVHYQSSDDTLILHRRQIDLASFTVAGQDEASSPTRSQVSAEQSTSTMELLLIPRNVAVGLGWLGAALAFTLAWAVAKWFPLGIHSLFVVLVVSASASIIWWPLQTVILGWIAFPTVLGGLVHLLVDPQRARRASVQNSRVTRNRIDPAHREESTNHSTDFSVSSPASSIIVPLAISVFGLTSVTFAQSSTTDSARLASQTDADGESKPAPIELLVPLDEDHLPVGDKVYLSNADYQSIRAVADPDRPVDVQFQSAAYRVTLSTLAEASSSISAEIRADYRIRLTRESTRVRLPLPPESIRRIELIKDDQSQIVRYSVDQRGVVIATLTPAKTFQLRCTLVPKITTLSRRVSNRAPTVATDRQRSGPRNAAELQNAADQDSQPADSADQGAAINQSDYESVTTIETRIPAIHSANLIVEAPREISIDSLGSPLGRSIYRSELGLYEAELGPVDRLSISCKTDRRNDVPKSQEVRRVYRISAGIESTLVECEVNPGESIVEGESFQLSILGPPPTGLTSGSWSMETTEDAPESRQVAATSKPTSGIYRFIKTSSLDAPISLFWRLRSRLNDATSTDDSQPMLIPEVFSSVSMRSAPTLFAIQSAPTINVAEQTNGSTPARADDFVSQWFGYPGQVDRAFVSRGEFPSFALLQSKYPQPTANLQQHLHVGSSTVELELDAEIIDVIPGVRPLQVAVPKGFELTQCLVNNLPPKKMVELPQVGGSGQHPTEFSLGDQRINGKTNLRLSARSNRTLRGKWTPPRFLIRQSEESDQTYRISRSRNLRLDITEPSNDAPSVWQSEPVTREDLIEGQVPVARTNDPEMVQVSVQRGRPAVSFRCDQLTVMQYTDGQWYCRSLARIPVDAAPDFVDFEIPTRWATELSVSGQRIWISRKSTDAATTVVRVALNAADVADSSKPDTHHEILLTSTLSNRNQIRVSVPAIKVLDRGQRIQRVAVPDRLTTEPIRWRARSVRRIDSPDDWFANVADVIGSPDLYSIYQVDRSNWSIELEPLTQATVAAETLACDIRVLMNGDHALVYQRFDLLPEKRNAVSVVLPSGGKCIGVWSAGREVEMNGLERHSDAQLNGPTQPVSSENAKLRIPLTYSRLPQSLELLVKVPVGGRTIGEYASRLLEIPTQKIWTAFYRLPKSIDSRTQLNLSGIGLRHKDRLLRMKKMSARRAIALAQSTVIAIDRSRDMLAERSDEEITRWLLPWITRYQSLGAIQGHVFRPGQPDDETAAAIPDENPTTETEPDHQDEAENLPIETNPEDPWQQMDAQIIRRVGRFLESNPELSPGLFDERQFANYELVWIDTPESFDQLPELSQSYVAQKSLQELLVNLITLMTFALAIILLWPFRGRFRHWIDQPALWLFIVGCLGMFLFPKPVAGMLMLVAITVPLFLWKSLSRSNH